MSDTTQTSDASVMAMRWKDRKDVFMLSTEHSSVQAMSLARSANRAEAHLRADVQ